MNKVILCGRLARDPEIRYSQGAVSMAVAKFSLAVNRGWKREGEPDADFFNCTAFKGQAEFIGKYLRKGSKVLVFGRIQNDNYTNKEGQKVYAVNIMVEGIEYAESKNQSANNNIAEASQTSYDGFMTIPDGADEEEQLPFA